MTCGSALRRLLPRERPVRSSSFLGVGAVKVTFAHQPRKLNRRERVGQAAALINRRVCLRLVTEERPGSTVQGGG